MSIEGTAQTEYASLSGKIHTFVVDKTLSISGACADAKETGDRIDTFDKKVDEALKSVDEAQRMYEEAISGMNDVANEAAENAARDAVEKLVAGDVGAYSKEETLATATAVKFGLPIGSNPDAAFKYIKGRFDLVSGGVSEITVTVKGMLGDPISNVEVTGIFAEDGSAVYTNENGVATGYISEGYQTIAVTGYADISEESDSFTVVRGNTLNKNLICVRRNFLKIIESRNLRFTDNVTRVDVTAVGGGGGGSGARNSKDSATYSLGGGGGGGYCTVQENVPFEPDVFYSAVIGSGGSGSDGNISSSASNSRKGGTGGTSSFLGVSANGGEGGTEAGSGYGPGETGAGNNTGTAGYSSFTETVLYGGCGGNGYVTTSGTSTSGGAHGAKGGQDAEDGFGGGGGGGCTRANANVPGSGGDGGDGCIAIRMHLAVA